MIRPFSILMSILVLATPAWGQDPPGESQRRAPVGMTASDGIGRMVADLYGETPAEGGYPPMRYFSREMQARIAEDRARPVPRVGPRWLRREGDAWPNDRFHAWVLNVSGSDPADPVGRPAYATVSLGFGSNPKWGRRLTVIDQDGYWVIRDVWMFPEGRSLSDALDTPGPTEPGHDPQPIAQPGD